MATEKRDVLTVLKKELTFLEQGGYRETARAAWRPQFIFQDSPTCLNFDPQHPPRPCSECAMMEFVPEALRSLRVPCRYIPIGEQGRSIEWYYRSGTQEELEIALAEWLKKNIAVLEAKAQGARGQKVPEVHVQGHFAETGE